MRLRLTAEIPSHGRGPRFDPLCVHQKSPDLLGFSSHPEKSNRQLDTERSAKRATRPVEYPWTLFTGCPLPPSQKFSRRRVRPAAETATGSIPRKGAPCIGHL